jgi:hypothetical protein
MNRRTFLHTVSAVTLAGIITVTTPGSRAAASIQFRPVLVQGKAIGRLFHGTLDGQLLESLDKGSTWRPIANFGAHCAVLSIVERQKNVIVKIGVGQFSFQLQSSDGRVWRTPDALHKA